MACALAAVIVVLARASENSPGDAERRQGTSSTVDADPLGGSAFDPLVAIADPRPFSLPLAFVENHGQWDTSALYVAQAADLQACVEPGALGIRLLEGSGVTPSASPWSSRLAAAAAVPESSSRTCRGLMMRLVFENASPEASIETRDRLPGDYNYFLGNDPSRWRTHVPGFGSIVHEGLYDGVDLVLRGQGGKLEYDLRLAPGADVEQVVIRCEGIEGLSLDERGSLVMATALGPVVQRVPRTWEEDDAGERRTVNCRFRLLDETRYGFEVASRDPLRRLVIDPGLTWSTFLGGSKGDGQGDVAVAANGDVIIRGSSNSPDFPLTPGAFDMDVDSIGDLSVTRMTGTGDALIFATFIGGSGADNTNSMSLGADDVVTLAGQTNSTDYPTTAGAFGSIYKGTFSDATVTRLSAAGDALLYSTMLGGVNAASEWADATVIRNDGTIIVTGVTCAADFPVTFDALDPTYQGPGCDGFVVALDPAASGAAQLLYSSFLLGGGMFFLTEEADGSVLGVGEAKGNFPVTSGAFDTTFSPVLSGGFDGLVCRLSPDLKTIVTATFLDVAAEAVRFAPAGFITLTGGAADPTLFTSGAYATPDGFLIGRMSTQLTTWLWGAKLGGSQAAFVFALDVDPSSAVMVAGLNTAPNFPTTPGAHDTTYSGGVGEGFVSYISADGTQLLYSTFLGTSGISSNSASGIAAADTAQAIVVGGGVGANFPVTPGAFDTSYNGPPGLAGADGYVVKVHLKGPWASVGPGLAGSSGVPKLAGAGTLCADMPISLTLTRAKPNGSATLVAGLSALLAPFKGGTFVPAPLVLVSGLPVAANGSVVIQGLWPAGVPSGLTLYFQYWIPDAAAVQGMAASNGLSATAP
jgi:hypothetical protein